MIQSPIFTLKQNHCTSKVVDHVYLFIGDAHLVDAQPHHRQYLLTRVQYTFHDQLIEALAEMGIIMESLPMAHSGRLVVRSFTLRHSLHLPLFLFGFSWLDGDRSHFARWRSGGWWFDGRTTNRFQVGSQGMFSRLRRLLHYTPLHIHHYFMYRYVRSLHQLHALGVTRSTAVDGAWLGDGRERDKGDVNDWYYLQQIQRYERG